MPIMGRLVAIAIFLALFMGNVYATETEKHVTKKFIQLGWDMPSTQFLKEHHQTMQQTPFDGTVFKIEFKDENGKTHSTNSIWDTTPWKPEWFDGPLADLKSCVFTTFTDNFLRFNASPGTIAWDDDTGWKILNDKTEACAKLLKQAGMKGFAPDFESYGTAMFKHDPASNRSFEETCVLARRRGKEWGEAIAKEFPDAVILSLWMNSINFKAGRNADPSEILKKEHYGLLPAFLDGMLDAAPPEMIFVDGCENGYYMNSEIEYFKAANEMVSWTGAAMNLVSPENRTKYRRQVRSGFGFYLDMFSNPEGSPYYRGPKEGETRLDRLRENLSSAWNASDQYVWIYGEKSGWWGDFPRWETTIPGLTETISWTKNPVLTARKSIERLKASKEAVNLIENPFFEQKTVSGILPAAWSTWQVENSNGRFSQDETYGNGSARIDGVLNGCFIQHLPAEERSRYYVSVDVRQEGTGDSYLTIRWQTPEGRWVREDADETFAVRQGKAEGTVRAPHGAGKLVVLLGCVNQKTEKDVCWFDNVELYRLE